MDEPGKDQLDLANKAGQAADFLRQSFSGNTTPTESPRSLSNSHSASASHSAPHTPVNSLVSASNSSYGREESSSDKKKTLLDQKNRTYLSNTLNGLAQQQTNAKNTPPLKTSQEHSKTPNPATTPPVAPKNPIPFSPQKDDLKEELQKSQPYKISPYTIAATFVAAGSFIAFLSYCDKSPEAMQNKIDAIVEHIRTLFFATKTE
jgi:hypothetical protein